MILKIYLTEERTFAYADVHAQGQSCVCGMCKTEYDTLRS